MHGFNRLGGNSVAETVVAGMIVGEFIADFCDDADNDVQHPDRRSCASSSQREQAKLDAPARRSGSEDAGAIAARMQEIMTGKVGIFRTGDRARSTRSTNCRSCSCAAATSACATARRAPIPELVTAYRVQKMLKLALCVAYGALHAHRKPRRAFPRGLPAPRRRAVAEAHARDAGRATATRCRRSPTRRST